MNHNTMKSTRFRSAIVIWIASCGLLAAGSLTGDQWVELTQWIFGIYAASEVGSKGAVAYRDKI